MHKRFARRDQRRRSRGAPARRARLGDRGAQARGPRPAAHRRPPWEPPGPIRFSARLDLKPAVDPGEYRGVPVEDQPVEPTDEEVAKVIDRIREAHAEFHPVEGRAAAPGDFAVADIAGSFVEILAPGPEPPDLPRREGHARGRPPRLDARDQRGAPGRAARARRALPQDVSPTTFPNDEFRGKTVDYEVTLAALKEKKLPAVDDEFARAVSEGDTVETLREKVRARLRHEKEADRRRKFRRAILDALLSRRDIPAPEVLVESETTSALRDYARYLAASGVDPEKEDWAKLARGGPAGSRAPGQGVPAARRDRRARGDRGLRDRARGRVQAGRRASGASSPPSCASRWRRRAVSTPCATRCAWPRSWTS